MILTHERRRVVHVAVTDHPISASTAQQLRNAFPNEECLAYSLHDRDEAFAGTLAAMQIQDVATAPRSRWQGAWVERFIGLIRRECLDHVIVSSAAGLQRVVRDYMIQSFFLERKGKVARRVRPISGELSYLSQDAADHAPERPHPMRAVATRNLVRPLFIEIAAVSARPLVVSVVVSVVVSLLYSHVQIGRVNGRRRSDRLPL